MAAAASTPPFALAVRITRPPPAPVTVTDYFRAIIAPPYVPPVIAHVTFAWPSQPPLRHPMLSSRPVSHWEVQVMQRGNMPLPPPPDVVHWWDALAERLEAERVARYAAADNEGGENEWTNPFLAEILGGGGATLEQVREGLRQHAQIKARDPPLPASENEQGEGMLMWREVGDFVVAAPVLLTAGRVVRRKLPHGRLDVGEDVAEGGVDVAAGGVDVAAGGVGVAAGGVDVATTSVNEAAKESQESREVPMEVLDVVNELLFRFLEATRVALPALPGQLCQLTVGPVPEGAVVSARVRSWNGHVWSAWSVSRPVWCRAAPDPDTDKPPITAVMPELNPLRRRYVC